MENRCEFREILSHYDSIFPKDKYGVGQLRIELQIIILKSDLPVHLRHFCTSPIQEKEIKGQVEKLLQAGKLNALCKADCEPLPIMDSLLDKLARAKFFSTLDLASGYWHVPIHPKDTEKLAFCTNFGLYEWCRLPFGIKVASAIFNRFIRRILTKYKIDFACNYFDDIIVFSSSENEHWNHLKTIFDICQKENIKLKLSKCVFAQAKINFLGYEIEEVNSLNIAWYVSLTKKRKQKKFGLLQQVPPTSKTFEFISVDTVGGFNYYNSTKKNSHIVIDHATRYVWAFPSKNENSETYANVLKQVFQIQIPEKLLTDRNGALLLPDLKKFFRNYNIKHFLTTAHRPQTNGKNERVNQSLVTRLKCKVNASSTKIPWTKLLDQVCNEYNSTPHSITKYPPAYLLFSLLPYQSPIDQNNYYEPVDEARELALQRTIDYHIKNNIRYDALCIEKQFNPGDLVVYEEFKYPNTRKLSSPFSGPYEIIKQCLEVTYEIKKLNSLAKKDS
ncbi:retrovirus-related Pol polyprotein from transposon 17.6 [Trichonephila clavipes]|nr:retrovirus-related Pol polyprotein from transposon 17.6 [Trichonephila clavipes]